MSDIDGKSASHTSPDQGQMRVTDNVFTLFVSAVNRSPHRGADCTLEELYEDIKNGKWWDQVAPVRVLAPYKDQKDKTGKRKSPRAKEYSELKANSLPYAVLSGTWDLAHRHADGSSHGEEPCEINGIKAPSGMRLLDLDGLDEGQQTAIKTTLDAGIVPWAAACWKSTGGDGLHLIATLDPPPTCQADSHAAFEALIADLAKRIPYAKHASDPSSKNLMRAGFISADSTARYYPDAIPLRWQDYGADQESQPKPDTSKAHTNQQTSKDKPKNKPASKDARQELGRVHTNSAEMLSSRHGDYRSSVRTHSAGPAGSARQRQTAELAGAQRDPVCRRAGLQVARAAAPLRQLAYRLHTDEPLVEEWGARPGV